MTAGTKKLVPVYACTAHLCCGAEIRLVYGELVVCKALAFGIVIVLGKNTTLGNLNRILCRRGRKNNNTSYWLSAFMGPGLFIDAGQDCAEDSRMVRCLFVIHGIVDCRPLSTLHALE